MKTYTDLEITTMSADELEKEIRHHNSLYWDQADPEISDYDYDRLVRHLQTLDPNAAVLNEMGPSASDRQGQTIVHEHPMLSLDKCYEDKELNTWAAKFDGDIMVTPKMDGIAASIRYDDQGRLSIGATRGNGQVGEDITANVLTIEDIPRKVSAKNIEVRGEIYMKLSVFETFKEQFSNPRNLAAGAIKQKDPAKSKAYGLSYAAYDVIGAEVKTEKEKLDFLQSLGFPEVEYRLVKKEKAPEGYIHFTEKRPDLDFEIDGVVFKANDLKEHERLGLTAHHPRYAIAYKFQGDSGITKLKGIEWSVARSGAITPVALIEPVELSGAKLARASLHHAGYIQKLNLTLNADVIITRRGGVIPNVEGVKNPGDQRIEIPKCCPSCDGDVQFKGDILFCSKPQSCRDAVISAMAYFAKVVGMEGFGEKFLSDAYDRNIVQSTLDLFLLTQEKLLTMDRIGEKTASNLLGEIKAHQSIELPIFLRALGIKDLAKQTAMILTNEFKTLNRIRKVKQEDLAKIYSVGDIIAENVVSGLAEQSAFIDRLLDHINVIENIEAKKTDGKLSGKSFVFTGKLIHCGRKEAQAKVEALGGDTPSSVTKTLNYLVVGDGKEDKKSSKQVKAEKLIASNAPLTIISESEFLAMIE